MNGNVISRIKIPDSKLAREATEFVRDSKSSSFSITLFACAFW
ncbi:MULTISPECIES: hypothetical protein [unclassified Mesorhizobium]|nr:MULTISPECIES: hypothetical protein [unclassified Mesorhizobium]